MHDQHHHELLQISKVNQMRKASDPFGKKLVQLGLKMLCQRQQHQHYHQRRHKQCQLHAMQLNVQTMKQHKQVLLFTHSPAAKV